MKLIQLLLLILGFFFVGIGIIGVVLPVLPTTPFLILASICFMKSSPKFDQWFRNTTLYKNYAEDFVRERAMTFKRKAKLMIISDAMLAFPLIKLQQNYLRLFIILIIIIKYWYFIFIVKTKQEEPNDINE